MLFFFLDLATYNNVRLGVHGHNGQIVPWPAEGGNEPEDVFVNLLQEFKIQLQKTFVLGMKRKQNHVAIKSVQVCWSK